ncbi:SETMR methyltransferase, partial [Acromyrmex insinuator]
MNYPCLSKRGRASTSNDRIFTRFDGCIDVPDLAPSDYYLFRSLQNSLDGKTLVDKRAAENHLKKFFADKQQKFYMDGIMKLPEKWQKVIDNNGQYILD